MSKEDHVYAINPEGLAQFEADFKRDGYVWQQDLLEWTENIKSIQGELTWWKMKRTIKRAFNVLPDDYDHFFERLLDDLQTEEVLKRIR